MSTQGLVDPQFKVYDDRLKELMEDMSEESLTQLYGVVDELIDLAGASSDVPTSMVEMFDLQFMHIRDNPRKGRIHSFMLAQAIMNNLYTIPARKASESASQ